VEQTSQLNIFITLYATKKFRTKLQVYLSERHKVIYLSRDNAIQAILSQMHLRVKFN